MAKITLMTQWADLTNFVVGNQKIVEETITKFDASTPENLKDVTETLEQSLALNNALMSALNRHPHLKKIILTKSI